MNARPKKLSKTARKALGIKEVSAYLDMKKGLEETVEDLKMNTRRYAKRQLTWFRGDERVEWIDAQRDAERIVEDIIKRI